MPNFEHKSEKDPRDYMEELKYGRFSMPDEEKNRIIKKAQAEGRDPEEALREHEERLAQATGRVREIQKEESIEGLEREMNKQFRNKEKKGE